MLSMNIPGFEILEKVGESSMTELWKARQVTLDRITAIRILKPECSSDERAVNSFVREARLPVKIHHANVPEIYDVGTAEDVHYVSMEYVTGFRVTELVQRDGPLSPKRALQIARGVAEALDAAWTQASLTHGNINPSCIRVTDAGAVKIMDLGFMHIGDPAGIAVTHPDGLPPGIPNYLAPEQADGSETASPRTDMYGLGATLFYMTTGRVPFAGDSPWSILGKHRTDQLPNPRDLNPKVTPGLAYFMTRLLMKNPQNRYPEWSAVLTDVRKILSGRFALKTAMTGISTIAALQRQQEPAPRTGRAVRTRQGPPATVRGLAWIVMFVLWGAVIVWRWNENGHTDTAAPGDRSPDGSSVLSSFDRGPDPAPDVGADNASGAQAPSTGPSLEGFLRTVSQTVLDGRPGDALGLVYAARQAPESASYRNRLPELEQFLREICRMDALLEAAFRDKVGETVVLTHNKNEYRVLLQATAGGRVRGLVEGQPVVFEIRQLNPLELSHWMGPPATPAQCAMKAILHFKGADIGGARVFAGRAGPLAEALLEVLETAQRTPDAPA